MQINISQIKEWSQSSSLNATVDRPNKTHKPSLRKWQVIINHKKRWSNSYQEIESFGQDIVNKHIICSRKSKLLYERDDNLHVQLHSDQVQMSEKVIVWMSDIIKHKKNHLD